MKNIKKIILSMEIDEKTRQKFVLICANWERFNGAISVMNKREVLTLIRYLSEERLTANKLLSRAIMRFNRLNKLTKEDLQ